MYRVAKSLWKRGRPGEIQTESFPIASNPATWFEPLEDRRLLSVTVPSFGRVATGRVAEPRGAQSVVAAVGGALTADTTPPKVVASSVAEGDLRAPGTLTFTVTFDEPMLASNLDTSDFTLKALVRNQNFSPSSLGYDATKKVVTFSYSNLPEDNYTLTLLSGDGRFEDAAGNNLDGEPVWPLSPTGSGDGVEGGNFVVDFEVDRGTIVFPPGLGSVNPPGGLIYAGQTPE